MTLIRGSFFPNMKSAYDAGVLIAGGSDFPYPSLWAGEAMHRETRIPARQAGGPGFPEAQAITVKGDRLKETGHIKA